MNKIVAVNDRWYELLKTEFQKDYFQDLIQFIKKRKSEGAIIYPPGAEIFAAFDSCPPEDVKVVIMGQDPYHGPGEAHGLCFSVRSGVRIPPSLRNIFKELHEDQGIAIPESGDLSSWAHHGVFLLNAILTVEHKTPASHKDKGWEEFTDSVIRIISENLSNVVFIFWGAYAKSKTNLIDQSKHLVLQAPHPAAEIYAGGKAGFFGSRPFSKANEYLAKHKREIVNWSL